MKTASLLVLLFLSIVPSYAWSDDSSQDCRLSNVECRMTRDLPDEMMVASEASPTGSSGGPSSRPSAPGEYTNVSEDDETAESDGPAIADPLEHWNRAMYHVNDKFYFWLLKPAAEGYKYVVPEDFRGLFSNFYRNLKAPIRIMNNLLQGRPGYAGKETARLLINSTIGVGGLKDCASECFDIKGRDAEFGQTLGKYGIGFGFYIVWPLLGPSSPRDTIGLVADYALSPTSYLSPDAMSIEAATLYAHEVVNTTSFRLGDYETMKKAAVDPYVAIRDAYRQHRLKKIREQ